MSNWIDYSVITIVVILGLVIFYMALKEPLDLVLYWLYRLVQAIVTSIKKLFIKASGQTQEAAEEIIYG